MKQIVLLTILLVTGGLVSAQTLHLNRTGGTVVIGSDGQPVNSSAALDIKSTTQGVLLPRLTSAQRTGISNPANGLLVFDTDTQTFWFRQNGAWVNLVGGSGGSGGGWQQNGANVSNTNSGNVGVGTGSPGARLSVQGSTSATGSNTADFYNPATGPNVSHIHYGSKGDWFIRSGASNGNVNIQDGTTGNVGIGTNIPGAKLHVEGGTYLGGPSLINGGASGGAVRIFNSDGSGTSFPTLHLDANQIQAINRGLTFPPSATPSTLKLNPFGGNVGIGTATAGAKLSVQGNTAGGGSNTVDIYNPTIGPNVSHIHYGILGDWFIRSGASNGNVNIQDGPTGNVGIGTNNPQAKLEINGNAILNGPLAVRGDISLNNALTSSALPGLNLRPIGVLEFNVYEYAGNTPTPSVYQVPGNLCNVRLISNTTTAATFDLTIDPALTGSVQQLYFVGGILWDLAGNSDVSVIGNTVRIRARHDSSNDLGMRVSGMIYAVY